MSLVRRSTGHDLEFALLDDLVQDELDNFRPMSSHARIEGMHTARIMDRQVQLQNRIEQLQQKDKTPRPQRKVFLPQLNPAKSAMLNTRDVGRRNQGDRSDPDDEEELTSNVDTDAFKQAMWAGQANILVTVRLRPHLSHDRDNQEIVKVLDHKVIVVLDAASDLAAATQTSPARRHTSFPARKVRNVTAPAAAQRRSREKRFAFDYVFTPEDGQQTVYSHTTKFLIHGVLNGFNATVFVYGNTGAGKTYTMLGTPDEPGIMALTLEDLFQNIQRVHADIQSNVTYRVTVSFLEVYNENIRDLLANQSASTASPGTPSEYLDLREDPIKGPIVAGISEIEACNASEVMKLLRKGNKHRSQEATAANAVSSRSHAVLQVLVEQREKTSASHITSENSDDESSSGKGGGESITTVVKFGKLSLVDLAGSERAAVTQNRGQRLLEGANINRSLLALGNCINALGEKGASTASFVPYRDSKLTRLLKDSLGGNCRTVMIANISLAKASLEETLNTLKYANRAKNIKTTMTRNVLNVDHHITEYVSVISGLKEEIAALKKQLVRQHDAITESSGPRIARQLGPMKKNNHEENNSSRLNDDSANSEMIQARLREVRRHITRYFSERLQLRESLLQVDFQIQELMLRAQKPLIKDGDKSGNDFESTSLQPEMEVLTSEKNQDDNGPNSEVALTEPQADQSERTDWLLPSSVLEELESLTSLKRSILEQLTILEERIEEFHSAIVDSPSLTVNELCREILLMEYRVGSLQIENMELQMARKFKNTEIDDSWGAINPQAKNGSDDTDGMLAKKHLEPLKMPLLNQASPKFSAIQPPKLATTTEEGSPSLENVSQRGSPRNTLGFMEDLRDRLYSRKSRHGDTASRQPSMNEIPSARKQWGIHLTSTALPYIRLKKKSPPSDVSSSPSNAQAVAMSAPKGNASTTAPYLRVLKHRRKSHQSAKKAAVPNMSSQKKGKLEHLPAT